MLDYETTNSFVVSLFVNICIGFLYKRLILLLLEPATEELTIASGVDRNGPEPGGAIMPDLFSLRKSALPAIAFVCPTSRQRPPRRCKSHWWNWIGKKK